MTRIYTFLCFLFISFPGYGQNQKNGDSLKYGHWKFVAHSNTHIAEGNYKIVPFSLYDTVSSFLPAYNMGRGIMVVRYKQHLLTIHVNSSDSAALSVKDGMWNYYDTATHNLIKRTCWENGIAKWTKKFDNNGNTTNYTYYDHDTIITQGYIDGRVFSKAFYLPGNDDHKITRYYPYDNMHISDAAPDFDINFITHPAEEKPVVITVKEKTTITSFVTDNNISVLDNDGNPVRTPMKLKPGKEYAFLLHYAPGASVYSDQDTILINTSDKVRQYKIISSASLVHIDESNVRDVKNLSLSISKDKYLYIKGCASETYFYIRDSMGDANYYTINGNNVMRLPLKSMKTDAYYLMVDMADGEAVGNIQLDITQ